MNPKIKKRIVSNKAIAASAGSGKTFQLAHRYIKLLAAGVDPERIVALTFSRKAAGEIFDSVVGYLADAAGSTEKARETAERVAMPEMGVGDFMRLLRGLLKGLNRLHVGTLDSFAVHVLKTFPLELGISPDFTLMDNDGVEAQCARQKVLSRIFDHRRIGKTEQNNFLESFKQATFGNEEKALQRSFDEFIGEYHGYHQLLPAEEAWGTEEKIWPDGSPWLSPAGDVVAAADELNALLEESDFPAAFIKSLTKIIDFARGYDEKAVWDSSLDNNEVFKRLLALGDSLKKGKGSIRYNRKDYAFSPRRCRHLYTLVHRVVRIELLRAMQRTRGLHRLLSQYEEIYDAVIRREGMLTFADTQYLLTDFNRQSGGTLMSRSRDQESRLYIDYRLDSALDHWLLDEFQDTSDIQWDAMANLIDEILRHGGARCSFFYVGDVKQAVYSWRGGNSRLFAAILAKYKGVINEERLSESFRSCRPIIDTVNRVFGSLPEDMLPAGSIGQWSKIWQEHCCNEKHVPEDGYAALLEPLHGDGDEDPEEARYGCVARLLKEIDPLRRCLTVAVLVRRNVIGKEIVDCLRKECPDMPVVHEGKAAIKDNPVVSLLLSLVKFAAHPGDTFAWRHIQMSSLNGCLEREGIDRRRLPLLLLRRIQAGGFQQFIRYWGGRVHEESPLDDYGRKRLDDLVRAAIEFDEGGSRDCRGFLRFIDNYDMRELAAENAIRVMTVHQAKGLGFDIVILPELQGRRARDITRAGRLGLFVARDPESSQPLWALRMPRRIIAESDQVLRQHIRAADEMACFDELCVLYVALTRAKRCLYMITSPSGKTSKSVEPANLVKMQLSGDPKASEGRRITLNSRDYIILSDTGNRDWYGGKSIKETEEKAAVLEARALISKKPSRRRRLVRISPSQKVRETRSAGALFAPAAGESRNLGSAVHEIFRKVEWIKGLDVEKVIAEWRESSKVPETLEERTADHFRRACASREFKEALTPRTGANVELWREKPFETVIADQWVTGVFDRVVIERDESGKPLNATIMDYKTDEITTDAGVKEAVERYTPQMELYRDALAQMLGIGPEKISLKLLFTHPGSVCEIL